MKRVYLKFISAAFALALFSPSAALARRYIPLMPERTQDRHPSEGVSPEGQSTEMPDLSLRNEGIFLQAGTLLRQSPDFGDAQWYPGARLSYRFSLLDSLLISPSVGYFYRTQSPP